MHSLYVTVCSKVTDRMCETVLHSSKIPWWYLLVLDMLELILDEIYPTGIPKFFQYIYTHSLHLH